MLKVKIEFDTGILHFFCPNCGSNDLLYITMPHTYYSCNKTYPFNVVDLTTNQYARYQYYKHKEV